MKSAITLGLAALLYAASPAGNAFACEGCVRASTTEPTEVACISSPDGPGEICTSGGGYCNEEGTCEIQMTGDGSLSPLETTGRFAAQSGEGPSVLRRPCDRPDGTFLRSITFSHTSQATDGRVQIPGSLLADGSVLGWWQAPLNVLARGPVTVPMVRFTAAGEPVNVIARLESRNEFGQLIDGTSRTYFPQPFTDSPLDAVAPDGSSLVVVRRNAATAPERTVFSIQRTDASGRVTLSRNYSYRPLPLTSAAVDRALDEHVRGLGQTRIRTPEAAALRRQLREHLYRPRFLPPVTALVLGRDGTIWLRREDLGRSMAWWHVLDARGRIIARAWVPANLDVRYADRTQFWAVERDENDVPTLVRFRIVQSR